MIERDIEKKILPYCDSKNIGVIAYSPMGSGLLTGKMTRERIAGLGDDDWRSRSDDFKEPNLSKHLELVGRMTKAANELG